MMVRHWRSQLSGSALLLCMLGVVQAADNRLTVNPVKSFDQLQAAARTLAASEYRQQPPVPECLSPEHMNYDAFRRIGFDDTKAIWGDTILPYRIGFYHKGYVHHDDVTINLIVDGQEQPLPFSKNYFQYREFTKDLPIPDDLGFAGFRVNACFPGQVKLEEIFSFVGASYFRARPAVGGLGTSARGLAIDCGLPKAEEFPVFREYWITEPAPGDTSLKVLALLDSPSVTGAYEFHLIPGTESTDIDVRATLYFRNTPEKVGFAPLSSMWMWGDGLDGPQGDHRPEVHDSDGLQIETADGTWLWRALCRQSYPSLVHLSYPGVRGFGLLQRDRTKSHYLDDEALYHSRPGVWIEPKSDWGPGAVELLELPAPHEGIDNVAVWWVPDQKPEPGKPVDLSYRISFFAGDRANHTLKKASAYRVSRDQPGIIKLAIDFTGGSAPADGRIPTAAITSIRGEVTSSKVEERVPGVWTTNLTVKPTGEGPVELKLTLKDGDKDLSETWAYLLPLEPPPVSLPPWRLKEAEKANEAEKAAEPAADATK
ncbi:glucan biosynthesis protein G [Planctomicrobium sp. SH664]|uniref:glucan biosynthesis protein G n=1 Tax=Planctomicrobium sp. SH664 TaxID=3448125 RepID=UPI003F5BE9A7